MNWFKNFKIRTKLLIGFILVSLVGAVVGFIGLNSLNKVDTLAIDIAEVRLPSVASLLVASEGQTAMKSNIRTLLLKDLSDERLKQVYEKNIPKDMDKIKTGFATYEPLPQTEEEAKLWNELLPLWKTWETNTNKELEIISKLLKDRNNKELYIEAFNMMEADRDDFTLAETALNKVIDINQKTAAEYQLELKATSKMATITLSIAIIIGFILSVFLGIILAQIISKPILKITKLSEKLSEGDTEIMMDIDSKDEIGTMAKAFEKMVEGIKNQVSLIEKIADGDMRVSAEIRSSKDIMNQKINHMLDVNNRIFGEITKASEQVFTASEQVAQSATAIAQSATEQSSTIEEITATVNDVTRQARDNATSANEANSAALSAKDFALKGSSQMTTMLISMNEINEASGRIAKIIKVIDDIAFQTNILALNAAVEAARAGSHGKGFAVVAEEVRNLAARSAQAANETTELIEGTIKKIKDGNNMAKETYEGLKTILSTVEKVSTMIDEITLSSGDQATAIAQISQAIGQISETVQANSAISEESAAASEELAGQAGLVKQAVSRFKIKGEDYIIQQFSNETKPRKVVNSLSNEWTAEDSLDLGKY